jgi:hypothetical protein
MSPVYSLPAEVCIHCGSVAAPGAALPYGTSCERCVGSGIGRQGHCVPRAPPPPPERTTTLTEWRRPRLFPYGSVFRYTYRIVGTTCQTTRRHTTDTTMFIAMALGTLKCTVVEFVCKDTGKLRNCCQTLMGFKSDTCRV